MGVGRLGRSLVVEGAMNGGVETRRGRHGGVERGSRVAVRIVLRSRRWCAVSVLRVSRSVVRGGRRVVLVRLRRHVMLLRLLVGSVRNAGCAERVRSGSGRLGGEVLLVSDDSGEIELGRVVRRRVLLVRRAVVGVGKGLVLILGDVGEMFGRGSGVADGITSVVDGSDGRGSTRTGSGDDGYYLGRLRRGSIVDEFPIDDGDRFRMLVQLVVLGGVDPLVLLEILGPAWSKESQQREASRKGARLGTS